MMGMQQSLGQADYSLSVRRKANRSPVARWRRRGKVAEGTMSSLKSRFVRDKPYEKSVIPAVDLIGGRIEGCTAFPLAPRGDNRGELVELLTIRDRPIWSIVHVYQVFAAPRSLRGWVYHERQHDRLAFTNGSLKVTLHDLREDSPTFGNTIAKIFGADPKALLTIPPFVAHCVENLGEETATFVNMPTRPYDLSDPDKVRLPVSSGLIPYPDAE
jgi:dTDP-4-dehydrorhamnose 3,5-epimerase